MEHDREPAHRVLQLAAGGDRQVGSAIVDGVAALGVAFLLLVLLLQIGVAMAARESAQAAVAGAARTAARPGADLDDIDRSLTALLGRTVPGARDIAAQVRHRDEQAVAVAQIRVTPPGPDWMPIVIRVSARAALVVPP